MKAPRKLALAALLLALALVFSSFWSAPTPVTPVVSHNAALDEATSRIRQLARSDAPIRLSRHARERMQQRSFQLEDIRETLANGVVRQPPRTGKKGELLYKMEHEDTRGTRDGEVVVIPRANELFIVTVFWDNE